MKFWYLVQSVNTTGAENTPVVCNTKSIYSQLVCDKAYVLVANDFKKQQD